MYPHPHYLKHVFDHVWFVHFFDDWTCLNPNSWRWNHCILVMVTVILFRPFNPQFLMIKSLVLFLLNSTFSVSSCFQLNLIIYSKPYVAEIIWRPSVFWQKKPNRGLASLPRHRSPGRLRCVATAGTGALRSPKGGFTCRAGGAVQHGRIFSQWVHGESTWGSSSTWLGAQPAKWGFCEFLLIVIAHTEDSGSKINCYYDLLCAIAVFVPSRFGIWAGQVGIQMAMTNPQWQGFTVSIGMATAHSMTTSVHHGLKMVDTPMMPCTGWWFSWNMTGVFPHHHWHILGSSSSQFTHILQRGWFNQQAVS